jgi:hypothetical protein
LSFRAILEAAEAWIIEGKGCGRVIDPEASETLE